MAIITGSNASETLIGTAGNDTITGAGGNDLAQMGDGADLFVWLAGDGKDTVEGGTGFDTLRVTASKIADGIGLLADGTGARLFCNLESIGLDSIERIEIKALGGTDIITVGNLENAFVTEVAIDLTADGKADVVSAVGTASNDIVNIAWSGGKIVVTDLPADVSIANAGKTDLLSFDGGEGNDIINAGSLAAGKVSLQILGGAGDDVIFGGAGDDTVTGGTGNDVAYLGAGNDLFISNDGDDADTIEGQDGTDTVRLLPNGPFGLPVDLIADGGRVQVSGFQFLNLNDVERIEIQAHNSGEDINIGDLSGTDVKQIAIVLDGTIGGSDDVSCSTGNGNDTIAISQIGAITSITGLGAHITIAGATVFDAVTIFGNGGDDRIDASKLPLGALSVGFNGEAGNDVIIGSQDGDGISGNEGNDTVTGGRGADFAVLGSGDDQFLWSAGDGSDHVDGEEGTDTIRVAGSKAGEDFTIASGDVSSKALGMNLDLKVERLELLTLDGADTVVVNNLGGGGFEEIAIDLAATIGGKTADSKTDTVDVLCTDADDDIVLSTSGSKIIVAGLFSNITVDHAGKTDRLTIQAGIGADEIDASAVAAGKIALAIEGQDGNDTVVGSAGNDTVEGGDGNDRALLGLGNDVFIWSAGDDDDTIEGEGGTDTVQFKTSSGGESIDVRGLAGRVRLTDSTGTLDLDDIERLEIQTGGGGDTIEIEGIAGTDLKQVAISLVPDSTIDIIAVSGTGDNDKIAVSWSGGTVSITGAPAQVTVANADANDQLVIPVGSGNDIINASTLAAGKLQLALRGEGGNDKITGGAGNDVIDGGAGADTLNGGAGHDIVVGEGGNDVIDGGAGNDEMLGGFDHDKLNGGAGNDGLDGGAGNDSLDGGAGNDELLGGLDDDKLNGGAGDDTLGGAEGNDTITGGAGKDQIAGEQGDDTINVSAGHATVLYRNLLDGHDLIIGFDGNATGGQDTFDLDALLDTLNFKDEVRAERVSITDNGASVEIAVDVDGNTGNGFELSVATLKTTDVITLGQDVLLGSF